MTAPTMRINTLTAGPLLRLLLALEGMEPPTIDPARGWQVFKGFMAMPAESRDDLVAFQAVWAAELRAEPMLYCAFMRQLTDERVPPHPGEPEDGFEEEPEEEAEEEAEELIRTVNLEWSYAIPFADDLEDVRLNSTDFPSLAEFTAAVEQLPHFQLMRTEPAFTCDLYEEMGEG